MAMSRDSHCGRREAPAIDPEDPPMPTGYPMEQPSEAKAERRR
jgi:hypothetical protein